MVSFRQLLFIALFAFSMPPASGLDVDLKKVFEKEADFTIGEGDDSFKATVGASIGYIFQLKPSECSYTAMVDPGTLTGTSEAFPFTFKGFSYTFPEQDLSYQAVDSGFHYTSDGGVTLTLTRSLPVGWALSAAGMSATLELSISFERTDPNPCCFSQWDVSMEVKFTVEMGPILVLEKASDAVVVKENMEINHLASEACSAVEVPTTTSTTTPTTTSTTLAPTSETAGPTTTSTTAAPTSEAPTTGQEITVCANEGQDCQCTGRVYYGKRFVNGKPGAGQRMTFEQMRESAVKTRDVQQQVSCANSVFGDPVYGYYKQCFCEKESSMTAVPTATSTTAAPTSELPTTGQEIKVCANEGQDCQCTGRVYYGKRFVNGKPGSGQRMSFEQMKESAFKTMDVQQQVSCANPVFGDPEHGYFKQCFCEKEARRLRSTVFV